MFVRVVNGVNISDLCFKKSLDFASIAILGGAFEAEVQSAVKTKARTLFLHKQIMCERQVSSSGETVRSRNDRHEKKKSNGRKQLRHRRRQRSLLWYKGRGIISHLNRRRRMINMATTTTTLLFL